MSGTAEYSDLTMQRTAYSISPKPNVKDLASRTNLIVCSRPLSASPIQKLANDVGAVLGGREEPF